jgi:hypothetical protein
VVDPVVVGPGFVYTPCYAVGDVVVVDSLWVRPCCCHYYFGDYYGPAYRRWGYESCIVYSDRHYDSIIVYRSWEYREDPHWRERQVRVYVERDAGRMALPPRTLAAQRTSVNVNIVMVAPASRVAAAQGVRTVPVRMEERVQVKAIAHEAHIKAVEHRQQVEAKASGPPAAPKTVVLPPGGHTSVAGNQHSSGAQSAATINGPVNGGKGPGSTSSTINGSAAGGKGPAASGTGPGPHPGIPQPHPIVTNPNNQHGTQPAHPPQKDQHPPQKDQQKQGGQ